MNDRNEGERPSDLFGSAEDIARTRDFLAKMKANNSNEKQGDVDKLEPPALPEYPELSSNIQAGSGGNGTIPPSGMEGRAKGVNPLYLLLLFLFALMFLFFGQKETEKPKQIETVKSEQERVQVIQQIKQNVPTREVVTLQSGSNTNAQAKVTIDPLKHFTCRTEDEVMNGFLHASVDYINTSKQSLRIPTGCVLVRFTGEITRISGNYLVFVPNKDEATSEFKWRFCGNGSPNPKFNRSSFECVNLVNENKSEDIRIVSYTTTLIE